MTFVPDVSGPEVYRAIRGLCDGDVLLLENVRLKKSFIKRITPLLSYADIFVLDALSVAHRDDASVTGFSSLPSYAGPALCRELASLHHITHRGKKCVYVLGGAKVHEVVSLLQHLLPLRSTHRVLVCGYIGFLFLRAQGYILGKQDTLLPPIDVISLLTTYQQKIVFMKDFGILSQRKRKEVLLSELPVSSRLQDIGKKTARHFLSVMREGDVVIMKGVPGMFESPLFRYGTWKLLTGMRSLKTFTVLAGGDTTNALDVLHISDTGFSSLCLAGGAFLDYLQDEHLPGLEALDYV